MGGHERISPTACFVAYCRTLSDIPYSQEIFQELQETIKTTKWFEEFAKFSTSKTLEIAPTFEARYKLVNRILKEKGINQVLEIASGFSPRGIQLAQDPSIEYIGMDLPGVAGDMKALLQKLISSGQIPHQPNYHLCEGSALNLSDLYAATSRFKEQPIAVVNEGLLRYLSFEEKAVVATNVRQLLDRFGGVWVTPDRSVQRQLPDEKEQDLQISRLTGIDLAKNYFDHEDAARIFFEKLGYRVEQRSFQEVADQLISPARLNLPQEKINKALDHAVFLMTIGS